MFQKLTPIFRILPTHRREGTLLNLFYEVSMVLIDKSNEYFLSSSLREAMSVGCPSVSACVGSVIEFVNHGQSRVKNFKNEKIDWRLQ